MPPSQVTPTRLLYLTLALMNSGMVTANSSMSRLYSITDAYGMSETVSLQNYVKDWGGSLGSGSDAAARFYSETGVRYGAFSLAFVLRHDVEINSNRDTAELYFLASNRSNLPVGRRFDINLDAYEAEMRGLRLAWHGDWQNRLLFSLGLSLLDGTQLTDGKIIGNATVVAENDFDFDLNVDYFYSEDALFERQVEEPEGQGFSIDFRLEVPLKNWHVDLHIRDLIGQINWSDAPFTTARANSNNKSFDDQGFVQFAPSLSGIENNRSFRQRLRPWGSLTAKWQPSEMLLINTKIYGTQTQQHAEFSGGIKQQHWQSFAIWVPDQQAFGLSLEHRFFYLRWVTDQIDFEKARYLNAEFTLRYPF